MKSQIFFVIPREEAKYKDCYKYGGKIWHNKLWFKRHSFGKVFGHYLKLIKEQREKYQETSQKNKDFLKGLLEDLKKAIEQQTDPQKKGQMNWFLENFSFRSYKYTYLKWIEKNEGSWKVNDDVYSSWQERENLLAKHDIKFVGEGLTRQRIAFNYRIPDNIIVKINNFLFNYNGVWFEVADYKQVEWDRLEVTANYSYYWNDYSFCLRANANGIIHNLPKTLFDSYEVCACPDFTQEEAREKTVFVVTNYELKWKLLSNTVGKRGNKWLTFWKEGVAVGGSGNPDFPWIKLGYWEKKDITNPNSASRDIIIEKIQSGNTEFLFSLVSKRGNDDNDTSRFDLEKIEAWVCNINSSGGIKNKKIELQNWLSENYPKGIFHCRANHIEASIQWRDKKILKGNHYNIRDLKITETSNPSGTVVTFYHGTEAIAEVHESIFLKIGKSEQGNILVNTVISIAAGAVVGAATGGVGGAFAAKSTLAAGTIAGGAKGAVASGLGAAAGGIKGRLLNHSETTRQEFTVDEFQHKFVKSGYTPIKIVLEHDKEVINRYWASKTIKKGGESNTYFNVVDFGAYFKESGFVKFHFHTFNMHSLIESEESKQWFKDNLQAGVQLINLENDPEEWYKTKLPRSKIQSLGSTTSGDIDTLETKGGGEQILGTFDSKTKVASYQTWLHTGNDDNLYRQIRAHFGGHTTNGGTVSADWNSTITGQRNAFCWGCDCKAFEAPIERGGTAYFLSSVGGSVQTMQIPDNCTIVCDPNNGVFKTKGGKRETIKRTTEGSPLEGWGAPPSSWIPTGGGLAPEADEPNMDPEINPPEPIIEPTETIVDGTELQVEPEDEPEDPEPDAEPEGEPNPEDTPEVDPGERTAEDDEEIGI